MLWSYDRRTPKDSGPDPPPRGPLRAAEAPLPSASSSRASPRSLVRKHSTFPRLEPAVLGTDGLDGVTGSANDSAAWCRGQKDAPGSDVTAGSDSTVLFLGGPSLWIE